MSTENTPDNKVDVNKAASAHQDELDENLSEDSDTAETDSEEQGAEGEDSPNEPENDKPKKKGGFQKRISKLSARASSAEAERDYWREQALKRNAQEQQAPIENSKNESKDNGEPNPDNFDTNAAYIKALLKWERDQEKAASEKQNEKTEVQKRAETFQNKINEFKKEHADFDDVIDSCEVDLSKDLQSMILESDLAPQLMYDLANKPEEIERLNKLSGKSLIKALGVLEDRLSKSSESQKPKPKTTNAPAPISPVGAKGGAISKKSLDDPNLSFSEYERLRRQQFNSKR